MAIEYVLFPGSRRRRAVHLNRRVCPVCEQRLLETMRLEELDEGMVKVEWYCMVCTATLLAIFFDPAPGHFDVSEVPHA